MIEFDTTDTALSSGGMVPAGRYHAVVEDVSQTENGQTLCQFEMVAGTNPDGVGKKHREYFGFSSAGARNRFLTFCVAIGVVTKEQWQAHKEAQQKLHIDESQIVMRSCIVEVRMEEYGGKNEEKIGKHFPQIGFRFYPLDDEKSKDVPRNPDYLPRGGNPPASGGKDWSGF